MQKWCRYFLFSPFKADLVLDIVTRVCCKSRSDTLSLQNILLGSRALLVFIHVIIFFCRSLAKYFPLLFHCLQSISSLYQPFLHSVQNISKYSRTTSILCAFLLYCSCPRAWFLSRSYLAVYIYSSLNGHLIVRSFVPFFHYFPITSSTSFKSLPIAFTSSRLWVTQRFSASSAPSWSLRSLPASI